MAYIRNAGTERPDPIPIPEDQVMGRRFIRLLDGQLQHLRGHCGHGNRRFFYDQLVVAQLLAFFNPILAGLRKIEDVFDVPAVRKRLKMPRVPKSTLADAQRLFEPGLLLPLFESLKERADIQPHDPRLDGLTNKLLAVDGSFFAVASTHRLTVVRDSPVARAAAVTPPQPSSRASAAAHCRRPRSSNPD